MDMDTDLTIANENCRHSFWFSLTCVMFDVLETPICDVGLTPAKLTDGTPSSWIVNDIKRRPAHTFGASSVA